MVNGTNDENLRSPRSCNFAPHPWSWRNLDLEKDFRSANDRIRKNKTRPSGGVGSQSALLRYLESPSDPQAMGQCLLLTLKKWVNDPIIVGNDPICLIVSWRLQVGDSR